jgi:hypothetical protein
VVLSFCPVLPDNSKSAALIEGSNVSSTCIIKMKISMDQWWNDTDRGKLSKEHWWNDTDRGKQSMGHWWNDTDRVKQSMEQWWNVTGGGNRSTRKTPSCGASLPTINLTDRTVLLL